MPIRGFSRQAMSRPIGQKPFPTRQLSILALCRLAEPIAFMSIFPYIYYMVKSFKITNDERQIAMYAGMVTSAFAMAEFLASIFWGRLSDRIGRKPVLLTGLFGTGISMLIFGFAPSLPVALFARAMGGILNGNIGVLQTTVAEVATEKAHQPRAFSIMPFVWCIGSIIGAGVGGALAEPVKNYPTMFQQGSIFERFPYLLPNLVCAAFVAVSMLCGIFFLEETHEDKKHRRDIGLQLGNRFIALFSSRPHLESGTFEEKSEFLSEDEKSADFNSVQTRNSAPSRPDALPTHPQAKKKYAFKDMFTNQVMLNIAAYGILAFHTIGFEQLLPVLFSMPESHDTPELPFKFTGGFELPTKTIGIIFASQGALQMLAQIFAFPMIVARLGPLKTFRLVIFSYPILYCLVPYLTLLPHFLQYPGILLVLIWKVTAQSLSYPSNTIMLVNQAPSTKVLGTLNGFAASSASLARTAGPTLAGIVQAAGLRIGVSGLSWWSCAAVASIGLTISLFQQEKPTTSTSEVFVVSDTDEEEQVLESSTYHDEEIQETKIRTSDSFDHEGRDSSLADV